MLSFPCPHGSASLPDKHSCALGGVHSLLLGNAFNGAELLGPAWNSPLHLPPPPPLSQQLPTAQRVPTANGNTTWGVGEEDGSYIKPLLSVPHHLFVAILVSTATSSLVCPQMEGSALVCTFSCSALIFTWRDPQPVAKVSTLDQIPRGSPLPPRARLQTHIANYGETLAKDEAGRKEIVHPRKLNEELRGRCCV